MNKETVMKRKKEKSKWFFRKKKKWMIDLTNEMTKCIKRKKKNRTFSKETN